MEILKMWDHDSALAGFVHLYDRCRSKCVTKGEGIETEAEFIDDSDKVLLALEEECKRFDLGAVADLINFTRFQNSRTTRDGQPKPDPAPSYGELCHRIETIDFLFRTQTDKHIFFRLTKDESTMFKGEDLFGAEVTAAFGSPEATYEITEAGKCLALGRHTATVFHLMRVLEKGLKALADNLNLQFNIPFDYQNWQNIIEQIESEIKKLEQLRAGQTKTDTLKAYSEIAKQFRYFKDAWRNGVAHSRETYGPEQALSIYRHVREFMQDIVKLGLSE
jgi:hypothetical protein